MNSEKGAKVSNAFAYLQLEVWTEAKPDTFHTDSVTQFEGATDRCRSRRRMAKNAITTGQSALAGSWNAKSTVDTRDRNGVEQSNSSGAICGTVPESRGGSSTEYGGQDGTRKSDPDRACVNVTSSATWSKTCIKAV